MTEAENRATLERIKGEIGEASWQDLAPHLKRDAVVIIDQTLDLAEAALIIAQDDAHKFKELASSNKIAKPNEEQLKLWGEDPEIKFSCVIIQPYVLVQLISQ